MDGAFEFSREDISNIVARASSFWERFEHHGTIESFPVSERKIELRLKEWLEVVAEGDKELFMKRLLFDGLDRGKICSLLGNDETPSFMEMPPWSGILNEVLRKMQAYNHAVLESNLTEKYAFLNKDFPVPFEELFLPFIDVAREKITIVTSGKYKSLLGKVRATIERSLLQKLSRISSRVLEVEFRTFLACRQLRGLPYLDSNQGKGSREGYLGFIKDTYEKSWLPLFEEYCVLSRLMATTLIQWVKANGEFLDRFEQDLPKIRDTFLREGDVGNIVEVRMDLSDPHDDGRSVISIEFDSGAKLIYKPKDLDLEVEYFRFVDWLNNFGKILPFRCLKILNRNGYGWVEFIDNLACENEEEVRLFYQRSGHLLGLVYAFNGMDFHFENLIACREHLVPVDLETIYHHSMENLAEDPELTDAVASRLKDSVLSTHLLPNPVKMNDRYYDISAIARSVEEAGDFEFLTWKNINTDGLDYNYEKIKAKPSNNLPKFKEKNLSPDNNVEEMVEGFQQMYRLLCDHKKELMAEGGPFHRIFQHKGRFIFRATSFYLSVLKKGLHPDYLRDGIDFDIQLDILSRPFLKSKEKPKVWPLIREEINALWKMDVPKFTAHGDGDRLLLKSGEVISDCFVEPAWTRAQAKIQRLGENDLQWQISLIKGSMDARDSKWLMGYSSDKRDDDYDSTVCLNKEELLHHAVALAQEIQKASIQSEKGEPGWLVLKFLPEREQFALRSMEFDLYNGRCGLALFFAALEKALPGLGYGEMAYSTLALVRRWMRRAGRKEIESLGVGGLVGIPSLFYSFVRIGSFLGDTDLLEEARHTALLISQKQIDSDKALDVLSGAAGTILCLLACQGAVGGHEILDKAAACGRHLLANRKMDQSGFKTWPTLGKRHLTGFSHGAAGIAYALLKLYQQTGESEYYDTAKEGIDFESHEFVPEKNNWPDHRERRKKDQEPTSPAFMTRWCHGAPGIGLARLGGLSILDSTNIRNDIHAALNTTSQCDLSPRDHLCCGNMGRVETLFVAGIKLSNPKWTEEALRITSKVLLRAKRKGSFGVTFRNGFYNPSLFHGAAGVGYQLLRLACPDEIPSLLLLE